MLTAVELVNRALSRIGCRPVQSLETDLLPSGQIPRDVYNAVKDDILGKNRWHFTKSYQPMTRLAAPGSRGWKYQFLMPADRLGPPFAYYPDAEARRPFTFLEVEGDRVHASCEQLFAAYQKDRPPGEWPTYVVELAELALMAEFALSIREDERLRASLRRETYGDDRQQGSGGQFAVAAALDAQNAPSQSADGGRNPLTDVRRGWPAGDAREGWDF